MWAVGEVDGESSQDREIDAVSPELTSDLSKDA
jgi:hypothetical protein